MLAILIIISLIINIFTIYHFFKWFNMRLRVSKFVEVEAHCIELKDKKVVNPNNYKDEYFKFPLYSYKYDNKEYSYEGRIEEDIKTKIGDKLIIRINPDKPEDVFNFSKFRNFFYFILGFITSILYLIFLSLYL